MRRAPVFQTDDIDDAPSYHYGPVDPCKCEKPELSDQWHKWRCVKCYKLLSLEARTKIDGIDRYPKAKKGGV